MAEILLFIKTNQIFMLSAIVLWTIPWKGIALWKAARAGSEVWFIFLFLLNTLGVLEILYIFIFSERKKIDSETPDEHITA